MFTQEEISKRIRDQLYLLDPEVSLEVGTPERKIIDIVAQSLTDVQFDKFVQTYQLDIDTKFGQDLDDFVQLFGFARQTAKRASGYVKFSRSTPADTAILIPAGTQVSTTGSITGPQILFTTVTDGIISQNGMYVEVPVEAVSPGNIGNITANKINRILSKNIDYPTVNNPTATFGGVEAETDDELKIRFKNNIFRNIAGTDDQLLALAIANQYTNRATAIGAVGKFKEYLTLSGTPGSATSSNPNAQYIYDFNYYLSNKENDITKFYNPQTDYTFSSVSGIGANQKNAHIVASQNIIRNPSPLTAPVAGTSALENFLQGNFSYAYTYMYSKGGESSISPPSNDVTFSEQVGTVTGIANSSGTSLAGGSVSYKTVYRKDLNSASPIWEAVGTLPTSRTFGVSTASINASPTTGTVATLTLTPAAGYSTVDLTGIESGTGNPNAIVTISNIGSPYNGVKTISSINPLTPSISYYVSGSSGTTTVTGTAIAAVTSFYDNLTVPIGEPPANDLTDGSLVLLEHEYLPRWSRNIYDAGNSYSNLNKVDIYISGQSTESAQDVASLPGNILVSDNPSSKYYIYKYKRVGVPSPVSTDPTAANYFVNLVWNPVRSIPSSLTINGTIYYLNTDYFFLKDITNLRDSYRASDGLEISSAMKNAQDNSVFSIDYTFDKLPYLTNKIIDSHRSVGQDILVHTANFRYFRVNLVIVYRNGFVPNTVNTEIITNLETYFNEQLFGAIMSFHDIENIVYQTNGVQNVRIAKSSDDPTYYGIQEVYSDGRFINTYDPELTDAILMEEIDLPRLYTLGPDDQGTGSPIAPIQKSQNNWTI
jgi:hypothetical protein